MHISKRDFLAFSAATGASMALPAWAQGKPMFDTLNMFVPAAPGGGWDGTARSIERAAKAAGLVGNMAFENVGGAGGMVGLPRFVNQRKGQGNILMVGGSVMIGAGIANKNVLAIASAQAIIARATKQPVTAIAAAERIIAGAAIQRVIPAAAQQAIGTIAAQDVFKTSQRIIAECAKGLSSRKISRDTASGRSVADKISAASAANQAVIARTAIQRVIAITAIKRIGITIAQDAVSAVAAQDIFNASQAVSAIRAQTGAGSKIDRNRTRGIGIASQIGTSTAIKRVIASAAK
jgi:hypothetical protein